MGHCECGSMKGAEAADDDDPGLDFTSCSFDALKALHTDPSRLQLPYPNVQPCDNLDAYESSKRASRYIIAKRMNNIFPHIILHVL